MLRGFFVLYVGYECGGRTQRAQRVRKRRKKYQKWVWQWGRAAAIWVQHLQSNVERRGRKGYAEVAEGIPKLFGKGLNQCLCGLQGINGWEGAWGLVVEGFYGFALLRLE